MKRLQQLTEQGQALWLDFTRRKFVEGGELRRHIDEDFITGVTSNPTIFDQAISAGDDYESAIRQAGERGIPAVEAFEEIAITDIQRVADELRPVYEHTHGRDGYVSMEVSPHLARDTDGSIRQGRDYWARIARPNLFIKIPATSEGIPAIRTLIGDGINVNITLLFSLPRYREVIDAYLTGLEDRLAAGAPIAHVASVASFFLSRIDLVVDPQLEKLADQRHELRKRVDALKGQAAIASAKQAYQIYKEIIAGERFQKLAASSAGRQRVLWASTSAKRPGERDVRYVEALIGPETINTVPLKTLEAFRDHGDPTARLEENLSQARATLRELGEIGVHLDRVGRQLEEEGVKKFIEPFDHLLGRLREKLDAAMPPSRPP